MVEQPSAFPARIHRLTREGEGDPAPVAADRHISGSGAARVWNAFTDASGRFHVGRWRGERGLRTVQYAETEFCLILEGRVRLDSSDGRAEFGPGDAFVIESGFLGTWENLEPVTKLYVVLDPEA